MEQGDVWFYSTHVGMCAYTCQMHTCTPTPTHAHMHAPTCTHAHTHTHTVVTFLVKLAQQLKCRAVPQTEGFPTRAEHAITHPLQALQQRQQQWSSAMHCKTKPTPSTQPPSPPPPPPPTTPPPPFLQPTSPYCDSAVHLNSWLYGGPLLPSTL